MITNITSIGNSRGIRIPAPMLKQCGFDREVTLTVRGNQLIVTPAHAPRAGWDDALAAARPEPLLIDEAIDLEMDDWKW